MGYVLLSAIAGFAVWFIYSQVVSYSSITESNVSSNRKMYLAGQAAGNLYEAESLSRQLILTADIDNLSLYKSEVDTIKTILDSLRQTYEGSVLRPEIDSINHLLSLKVQNLEDLLQLRVQGGDESYYSRVISELQRVDENFDEPDYEERFKELEPHQRRWLVRLLEFSETESQEPITTRTLDSVVNSVKDVLSELERSERLYQQSLRIKEDELLANEISLNNQLRSLLSTIEAEERQAALAQVSERQAMLSETSQIITVLAAASFLVILFFLFLVIRDVTKSRQYRVELEDAKQYAETLLKRREQFMATVTHDLRSPLNTIIGYTDLLDKTTLSSSQKLYLNHLKKSSDYILHLVNDLLDLSKLEAGKMSVEKLVFNPKNLLEDCVENTVPAQKNRDVDIMVNISEELNRPIESDPFRIKQIVTNLVTNAFKFTEQGKIEIKAIVEPDNQHEFMVISVRDTGIGISAENQQAIFEEFSQENSSIEKRYGGSGLGLAITKKLTDLLGGTIDLESEQGKGSKFTVRIPVRPKTGVDTIGRKKDTRLSMKKVALSILIVDDEPAQQTMLRELLKNKGIKCSISNNGEEAVRKLRKTRFNLVLTDIQMPEMNGFELLRKIRSNPDTKHLPVIVLSGKADTSEKEYLQMGFNGSLLKPYSSEDLLRIIGKVLAIDLRTTSAQDDNNKASSGNYSLKEVQRFAGDDREALKTILKAFIESSRINLSEIRNAGSKSSQKRISAIAHKMLPMFRQLDMQRIVKQLEGLESSDKDIYQNIGLEKLTTQIEEVLAELEKEIKD